MVATRQVTEPTKARLIEAAGEEFAAHGFDGATVRDICERAGANLAAINYHFGGKEALYVQAVMEAHRCGVEPADEGPGADDGPPADRLRRHVRDFLSKVLAVESAGWHHGLMLRELVRPSHASETLVREVIRPKFDRMIGILRAVAGPEADERRLNAAAFSVIGQCLHYRMARAISTRLIGPSAYEALDLDFLTDHITGFSMAALGLGPPVDLGRSDGRARGETP